MDLNRHIYGSCTPEEWAEYCWMPQVRTNETPINARKLIHYQDGTSYAPTIGIAICLSCNELVYTGKNIRTMENHWKSACTGIKYCELKYEDFFEIKHKPYIR